MEIQVVSCLLKKWLVDDILKNIAKENEVAETTLLWIKKTK